MFKDPTGQYLEETELLSGEHWETESMGPALVV